MGCEERATLGRFPFIPTNPEGVAAPLDASLAGCAKHPAYYGPTGGSSNACSDITVPPWNGEKDWLPNSSPVKNVRPAR